jgi:hypothetical protein
VRFIFSYLPSLAPQLSRLYLLPRNRTELFAYWYVTAPKLSLIEEHYGRNWLELQPSLRLYDITGLGFGVRDALDIRQIPVEAESACYIQGLTSDRMYIADLGFSNQQDLFIPLVRSNRVTLPFAGVTASSVDNFETLTIIHPTGPLLPYGYDQFSAYTLYSLIPSSLKKADSRTGGDLP